MSIVENTSGVILVFNVKEGHDNEDSVIRFAVPEECLWSGDHMRDIFNLCRAAYLVNPGAMGFDESVWEGWHLVAIEKGEDFNVLSDLRDILGMTT